MKGKLLPDPVQRSHVRLDVVAGPHTGHQWTFDRSVRVVLGRCPPSHLRLGLEPGLSAVHCELAINPPHVSVTDLASTNGTLVNGIPIAGAVLGDGDELAVGETRIRVCIFPAVQGPRPRGLSGTGTSSAESADCTLFLSPNGESPPHPAPSAPAMPPLQIEDRSDLTADSRLAETQIGLPEDGLTESEPSEFPPMCGPYNLEEQVGEGGMATVYRGRHRKTGKLVAIKLIRVNAGPPDKMLQLFVREASVLLKLNHPRIVRSIEFGFQDHQPFLVLEWLPVIDLAEFIDPLPRAQKIRISCWVISRVLQGLHYAHQQGFVHRDVKPSNILAYREAHRLQVKLGDFGLAKCYDDAGLSAMTDDFSIRGTLAYMSPEQLQNSRSAGPPSDIFSSTACLYRLLTGKHPKLATLGTQSGRQALREARVPSKLIQLIETGMHPTPDARPRNAASMYRILEPFFRKE